MKFSIFVIVLVFCKVKSFSRSLKCGTMETAFINISETLATHNHVVAIVVDSVFNNKTDFAPFASFAGIPHIVAKFDNTSENFLLNSSAIVLLNTIASLETFNSRTILPVTSLNVAAADRLLSRCNFR